MVRRCGIVKRRSETAPCTLLQDNGKPLAVARAADIPLSVAQFRYFAGWADKITGAAQLDGATSILSGAHGPMPPTKVHIITYSVCKISRSA